MFDEFDKNHWRLLGSKMFSLQLTVTLYSPHFQLNELNLMKSKYRDGKSEFC